ncbi:site-specific integrase [Amycolatopsis sp. CA-128772]|uniref:tyrosine-type recombinase/integrase n=1 Tax=Amycolatopsis sp. CA-128772 TaxID=2073159 RepID=UPI001304BA2F|nr:site-specific integrase [Amycolatopsis sp. CA-128772]
MTDTHKTAADPTAAARLVLESLGVSLSDLQANEDTTAVTSPTFREYIPVVAADTPASSRRLWSNYWRFLVAHWGDRRVDEPSYNELFDLADQVEQRARSRKGSRGGHGARSNFVDAIKCVYRHAVDDEYVRPNRNPAAKLRRSGSAQPRRRALSAAQLTEITHTAATTGPNPALDSLVLRLHTETACRRSGVLSLRRRDLNDQDCTIWLREKGTARERPVSPTVMAALVDHFEVHAPSGNPDDPILRYANGRPIGDNYFQGLWQRLRRHLDWADRWGVSAHWLRYTTLTWVERNFGYAMAAAYAGHAPGGVRSGNTLTYVHPTLEELSIVLATLVGAPHPLAVGLRPVDTGSLALQNRGVRMLLPVDDDVRWRAELERSLNHRPVTLTSSQTALCDPVDPVRQVRHQLEQAERYGMRRPSQRTLVTATGLPRDTVREALNKIKLELIADHTPDVPKPSAGSAQTSVDTGADCFSGP